MYICSLLVSCVADNGNVGESYIFLNEKHALLYSLLSLECWKSHCRALKSQNLLREYAPRPPRGTGLTPPFLIQSGTLFKADGYFNCY